MNEVERSERTLEAMADRGLDGEIEKERLAIERTTDRHRIKGTYDPAVMAPRWRTLVTLAARALAPDTWTVDYPAGMRQRVASRLQYEREHTRPVDERRAVLTAHVALDPSPGISSMRAIRVRLWETGEILATFMVNNWSSQASTDLEQVTEHGKTIGELFPRCVECHEGPWPKPDDYAIEWMEDPSTQQVALDLDWEPEQ